MGLRRVPGLRPSAMMPVRGSSFGLQWLRSRGRLRWIGLAVSIVITTGGCGERKVSRTEVNCPPLGSGESTRLARFVQKKYKLSAAPKLTEVSNGESGCYRKLRFSSADARKPFRVELYVSPDFRFLSSELLDSSIDPEEEERRKEQVLSAGLKGGDYPASGQANAPVTLTVFSDFQCPYCAKLARMLSAEILPDEAGIARLVFRHFPLQMHAWARAAAEATACAQEQSNEYFWKLHDFLFEHQSEFTPGNVQQRLFEEASHYANFDPGAYRRCVSARKTKEKVEKDIAFGTTAGITGTPTLFVNTHRLQGVAGPEQIRTLIRELSRR